ncbi:MAG: helix-turn-helix transcriptional regulator [Oligoflexus sp.]|nr:helix-turn-helix transcriptional regulator [Oligoflexus sp.]
MIEFRLGQIIQSHRKKSGLTQQELAVLAGVGKTAIFDLEHGTKSPRLETLQRVCRVLNIKIRLESPFISEELPDEEG